MARTLTLRLPRPLTHRVPPRRRDEPEPEPEP